MKEYKYFFKPGPEESPLVVEARRTTHRIVCKREKSGEKAWTIDFTN